MYVSPNFKTKKELKKAVELGKEITIFSPGPFPPNENGKEYIEGPHYPESHRWYAQVEIQNSRVVKVLS